MISITHLEPHELIGKSEGNFKQQADVFINHIKAMSAGAVGAETDRKLDIGEGMT
jgi:hypothetical protein